MSKIKRYGVIGFPVDHSLSPQIHPQFAQQFGHIIEYQKYPVRPEELQNFLNSFFEKGGKGLNVTLPHKQMVIQYLDEISTEARLANSVNTISINSKGLLIGDTTDGIGLLGDLNAQQLNVQQKNILVIGTGGACQSILISLLNAGAKILLLNRTKEKTIALVKRFSSLGDIKLFDEITMESNFKLDGVISSISEFNPSLINPLKTFIDENTFFYDLNYGARAEQFLDFAKQNRVKRTSDGLGMLLGQAAKSYQIWHGELPSIGEVKLKPI